MCSEEKILKPNAHSREYATRLIIDKAVYKRFRNAVVILNITFSIGNCTRCLSCGPIGYKCKRCNSRNYYRNMYVETEGIETHEVYNPIELAEAAGGSVDIYSSLDDFTNGALRIWHMHQDVTISRNAVMQALERNRSTPNRGLTMEQIAIIRDNTGVISQVDIADAFDHGPLP